MGEDKDTTNQLYPALLAALREMGPVRKEARGNFGRYANLDTVLDTVTDPLHNHGIILTQTFDSFDGTPVLVTRLIHAASGDTISGSVPVVAKEMADPQKVGGAITYYRRYSILAILGLTAEDDDGQSASQSAPPPRPTPSASTSVYPRPEWRPPTPTSSSAPAPSPAPASVPAQSELTEPATKATWTDVWSLARTQGITDKVSLAQACAVQSAATLDPDEIIKRLKRREVR